MSAHYLGIDIGGTATRWAVVVAKGTVVARGKARGATGHLFNPAARADFTAAIAEIAQAHGDAPVHGAFAGITGLGPITYPDAKEIIGAAFGLAANMIDTADDMELAFRAVFAPGTGHLVSAGTGSIGLHIAEDGKTVRVGGRGILIDDAGSGAWIALRALNAIYRRIDETGGPADASILANELFDAIDGQSWDAVRAYVYAGDRGKIGALALPVARAAERGDPVAVAILADAAHELARLGRALVDRTQPLPIAYIGGVLALHNSIKPALRDALADFDITFPTIDAPLAAANIARQRAQTTQDTPQ
ncbi:N-acetylglucosamine kinase [Pelagibacterium halotolerans]|uniref:N-acetylglucosamine kinase n=1 Tax=Pelagibacterium halotolerans TaxID=531813 RepID=UPI00384C301D